MNQDTQQNSTSNKAGGPATPASAAASAKEVKVVTCVNCEGPVADNVGKCFACGAPLTGKEFAYIPRSAAGPDIAGMVKWWAILSVFAFAIGGFSFGVGSSLAFTVISVVYGVKILRAYFL